MNHLKQFGLVILALIVLLSPSSAFTETICGTSNTSSGGNLSFNFTVNGSLGCESGVDTFNITAFTTDTNITKLFNFTGSNWSMGIRLIMNNTDNSTYYSVRVYNGTNTTGNVSHNVTIKSNATGWATFNMTGFNNTGWINVSIIPTPNTPTSTRVYSAAFAVIVGLAAVIFRLRKVRKV